jgi:hypothetical protein
MGRHMTVDETGLYTVQNGKIVKEEFFYSIGAEETKGADPLSLISLKRNMCEWCGSGQDSG